MTLLMTLQTTLLLPQLRSPRKWTPFSKMQIPKNKLKCPRSPKEILAWTLPLYTNCHGLRQCISHFAQQRSLCTMEFMAHGASFAADTGSSSSGSSSPLLCLKHHLYALFSWQCPSQTGPPMAAKVRATPFFLVMRQFDAIYGRPIGTYPRTHLQPYHSN